MIWSTAGVVLVVLLGLSLVATARGSTLERVVGLELASTLLPLVLVVLAVALQRRIYLDVAVAVAVVAIAGGLAYARFLERWL